MKSAYVLCVVRYVKCTYIIDSLYVSIILTVRNLFVYLHFYVSELYLMYSRDRIPSFVHFPFMGKQMNNIKRHERLRRLVSVSSCATCQGRRYQNLGPGLVNPIPTDDYSNIRHKGPRRVCPHVDSTSVFLVHRYVIPAPCEPVRKASAA